MLQIQFLDTNIVKVLAPVHSRRPDHLILLYDASISSGRSIHYISLAVAQIVPGIVVETTRVDKHHYEGICQSLRDLLQGEACQSAIAAHTCEIIVTGGTELMTAAGIRIGTELGLPILYVSTSRGVVFDVITGEKVGQTVHVRLEDYLTAIGAKKRSSLHRTPPKEDFALIEDTAAQLLQHHEQWLKFAIYCMNVLSDISESALTFTFDASFVTKEMIHLSGKNVSPADFIKDAAVALEILEAHGLIEPLADHTYRITKPRFRDYMINYGCMLEMFIYIRFYEFFDEIEMGYVIDWDEDDGQDTNDNEIDVIGMKQSVPYLISCKMRGIKSDDVYEIAALARRLGGSSAKAVIATTMPIQKTKQTATGIYYRLQKMHIAYIEAMNLIGRQDAVMEEFYD